MRDVKGAARILPQGFRYSAHANRIEKVHQKSAVYSFSDLRNLQFKKLRQKLVRGGGIRSGSLNVLLQETCCAWFHSSAITDGGDIASAKEIILMKWQLHTMRTLA